MNATYRPSWQTAPDDIGLRFISAIGTSNPRHPNATNSQPLNFLLEWMGVESGYPGVMSGPNPDIASSLLSGVQPRVGNTHRTGQGAVPFEGGRAMQDTRFIYSWYDRVSPHFGSASSFQFPTRKHHTNGDQ